MCDVAAEVLVVCFSILFFSFRFVYFRVFFVPFFSFFCLTHSLIYLRLFLFTNLIFCCLLMWRNSTFVFRFADVSPVNERYDHVLDPGNFNMPCPPHPIHRSIILATVRGWAQKDCTSMPENGGRCHNTCNQHSDDAFARTSAARSDKHRGAAARTWR